MKRSHLSRCRAVGFGRLNKTLRYSVVPLALGLAGNSDAASICPTAIEQQMVDLINQERQKVGLSALKLSGYLVDAARWFANDLATHPNLNLVHVGSDGASVSQRVSRTGYPGWPGGEIQGEGYDDAADMVRGWMQSTVHRNVILSSYQADVGCGYAYNPYSIYGTAFVCDFGLGGGATASCGSCGSGGSGGTDKVNVPPVAKAGSHQTVRLRSLVRLSGAGSYDPDKGPAPLTYKWKQIGGSLVTLNGGTTPSPTFRPSRSGTYAFTLTVYDGKANSAPAKVTITVPKLGDINLDGVVNSKDIALVRSALGKRPTSNSLRDLNGDGAITNLDVQKLKTLCTKPVCAI